MQLYTGTDIARGAGIFDYVMATELESPRITVMRAEDAIGIIAAAFASGLDAGQVENFVEDMHFHASDHELLKDTLCRYEGGDGRFHLWNSQSTGSCALCPNLQYYSRPAWHLTPATRESVKL